MIFVQLLTAPSGTYASNVTAIEETTPDAKRPPIF